MVNDPNLTVYNADAHFFQRYENENFYIIKCIGCGRGCKFRKNSGIDLNQFSRWNMVDALEIGYKGTHSLDCPFWDTWRHPRKKEILKIGMQRQMAVAPATRHPSKT